MFEDTASTAAWTKLGSLSFTIKNHCVKEFCILWFFRIVTLKDLLVLGFKKKDWMQCIITPKKKIVYFTYLLFKAQSYRPSIL